MSLSNIEFQCKRFESFEQAVLSPAVYTTILPLSVEAVPTADDLSPSQAQALAFEPVELGHRWGPKWQRMWFRLTGDPGSVALEKPVLRFSSGSEALLFSGDDPWHGFDCNRDAAPIPPNSVDPDGRFSVMIEAECMHPWGVAAFTWDTAETHQRWASNDPGHLTLAELASFDEHSWRLLCAYRFARQLLAESPADNPQCRMLVAALDRATRCIDDKAVAKTADDARQLLTEAIKSGSNAPASTVTAVGHAHIDTAWLWTLDHTRRKTQRSWSNVIRLAERFDDFRFLCTQPYQYAQVAQDAPSLSARIDQLVASGKWEPFGAAWIEPDCSIPSVESLIRQIMHGIKYFEDRFPNQPPQRCLFLPDTFGFPASLPTVMVACGLDTFITNKMSWNQTNRMPMTSFTWKGIDGSEVLGHLTPGGDYNASNTPAELIRGEKRAATTPPSDRWLQPFGFGDGGGGPTDWQIQNAELAADCPGLPKVRLGTASRFIDDLHRDRNESERQGRPWPIWDGELYLELHRGTLTTQSELKRLNRACESALRQAEMLWADDTDDAIHTELHKLWQRVLLLQFHDILPGSSIREVNQQALAEYESVLSRTEQIRDAKLVVEYHAEPTESLAVFNPASAPASAVIDIGDHLLFVQDVAGGSIEPVRAASTSPVVLKTDDADGVVLENGIIRAHIDTNGQVSSLILLRTGRDICDVESPMHRLRLYRDRPHMWDAWDIDPDYELDEIPIDAPSRTTTDQPSPLRASVTCECRLGDAATATVKYTLDAGSAVLAVDTLVSWQEQHRVLRVEYPTSIRARYATFEIQGGEIQRPTHRNTPWDRARFEVPVQRWMDIAEPGAGVAVLNTSKYGASCNGSALGLSLLRAPTHPDPEADRGKHAFRTAILPHAGDRHAANVADHAEQFNAPLRVVAGHPRRVTPAFEIIGGRARCELTASKRGTRDRSKRIMRFVETAGAHGQLRLMTDRTLIRCDALERETGERFEPGDSIPIKPFEILTIAL